MDTKRLAEIRARLEAADPGPWVLGDYRGFGDFDIETADGHDLAGERGMFHGQANAELAAHAPADLAYLLDRVERMEKVRQKIMATPAVQDAMRRAEYIARFKESDLNRWWAMRDSIPDGAFVWLDDLYALAEIDAGPKEEVRP